jgi:phenylacetate-CoA ligase
VENLRNKFKDFYLESPAWFKTIFGTALSIIPHSIRYGPEFLKFRNLLRSSQWWNEERLARYQMDEFKRLLEHAYRNVPYYRRLLKERNLTPERFSSLANIRKLPFLTKEIIHKHFQDLIAQNIPRRKIKMVTTGGTSNTESKSYMVTTGWTSNPQLKFYIEKTSSLREWAFITTQWERANFRLGDKRLVLRGTPVDSSTNDGLWAYDPLAGECRLSIYHLTERNLFKYVEVMRRFSPDFIHGYPSAVAIVAQFILENKIENLPPLKGVLCGSEAVIDHQRKLIEKAFKTRLLSWYGQSEKVILAGECETSCCYHVFPEYGITELVDENGKQITEPNRVGELVGTGFMNFAMPFIRYKTGDWASFEADHCQCGRKYPLLKMISARRSTEFLLNRQGNLISAAAINMHDDTYRNARQFQFCQEKPGQLVLKIIKGAQYTEGDSMRIISKLNEKLRDSMEIKIQLVENLPLTKSGKYRFIDQRIPIVCSPTSWIEG